MSRQTANAYITYPTSGVAPFSVNDGAAWTYGSWLEVIPSAAASTYVAGFIFGAGPNGVSLQVQIGVGNSGAETPIHTWRTFCPNSAGTTDNNLALLPMALGGISTGQRVAVRVATNLGTETLSVGLVVFEGLSDTDHLSTATLKCYPDLAGSVQVTPSGVAWAWSAWTPMLSGGVSNEISVVGIVATAPDSGVETEFELGTGPSGSVTGRSLVKTSQQSAGLGGLRNFYLPAAYPIAANTPLWVRMRKSGTATNAYGLSVIYLDGTDALSVPPLTGSLSEAVTVSEAVTALLTTDIYLTVAETVSVAEAITQRPNPILLAVYEAIGVTEDSTVPASKSAAERIYVRDGVDLSPNQIVVNAHELISVAEGPLYRNSNGVAGALGPEPSGATGTVDYWTTGL